MKLPFCTEKLISHMPNDELIRHSSSRFCVKTALASLAESSCPVLKDTFVL